MEAYGVIELTLDQLELINGGKPLGYYLGLGVGFICGTFVSFVDGIKDGLSGEKRQ